ncbi:MAG: 16S rRNA (adenine(1518)-N(6)/adenine(1519)-N(6))-dimethyltransferase RsmA [Thermomicrobiales bacterium]|nr:16S rRNA (adenine(1518)-N(6)/adenine(1519)-N(6))-dimethyltransferase RsmA [Thermomicrobiales bacterium]
MRNLQRTPEEWRRLLTKSGVRPSKAMGQNFLTETSIVERIVEVAGVHDGSLVIEVGPGMGILTRQLLMTGAEVIGVELDRELATLLRKDLADIAQFSLVEQDARYLNPPEITGGRPYQVVANLPYSVASVILRNLMECAQPPVSMTVMVQREVAERMAAEPGDMSLLGLATDLYAAAEIAFIVPKEVFLPPPKIESAVVHLELRHPLRGTQETRDRMFELATMAFQRKRKTLGNGLSMGLGVAKVDIDATLTAIGIDPMRRPQTLGVDDWLAIAEALP